MLGTDMRSPGGMTAVARAYLAGGLFDQWPLRYLATYHKSGAANKLGTAGLALLRFLGWLLTGRVAAVHAHVAARGSFWRKSVFLLLGRMASVPTFFHLHDGSFPAWYAARRPCVQAVVRWVLRRMDRVLVLTEGWRAQIVAIEPQARILVLGNPVSPPSRASRPVPGEVLFLARLWRDKGIYDLLEAGAQLVERHPALRLVCAGDGELAQVQACAQGLGLADRVILTGWVDGPTKDALFASASVFVLPSYYEGLPVGVLEAMAWGVPVLASEVGGIPEALGTEGGLMFRAGDVAGLVTQLDRLLGDADLRHRLAEVGRLRVDEHFACDKVLAALGAIYADLGLKPLAGTAAGRP